MTNLRKRLLAGAVVCAAAVSAFDLPSYAATFIEFDPPGSMDTHATGISDGVITGYYDSSSIHGFVRAADGSITTFDPPHSIDTFATSINKAGSITGYYAISSGVEHGVAPFDPCTASGGACFFVRTADGAITVFFIPPDGVPSPFISINDSGVIAGSYGDVSGVFHGFVRSPHGKITTFDPAGSTLTWATSINDGGVITGLYTDTNGTHGHGFVRAADGSITAFDVPQSIDTEAWSINKAGTVAGDYLDSSKVSHGFARTADGTITTFDPSGSTGTVGLSIAKSGTVAGDYLDSSKVSHGFARTADGTIKSFDPPKSSQTFPAGVDSVGTDRNAITGYYVDSSSKKHGFLRTP